MLSSRLYERIFKRWRSRAEFRPQGGERTDGALQITWLGTAGHIVETARTTVLIDPFLTRPSLGAVFLRPLVPDDAEIARHLPVKVDAVLLSHSHYDHLLDAPTIAKRWGSLLVGSATTCAFARASGVPAEQIHLVPAHGATLTIGDIEARFIPSRHAPLLFGVVPLPGEVARVERLPARAFSYRMGGAFGLRLSTAGVTLYHNGSADLVDAQLAGAQAEILLVGVAGRRFTPDYLRRLVGLLAPKVIVPTHHDAFFAPLAAGVHLLPDVDLDAIAEEIRSCDPSIRFVTPDYLETLSVPAGAAAAASFTAPRSGAE